MVRLIARRDHEVMTSTEHTDRPPSVDRDGPLLIAYDGSEHAKNAIRSAAGLLTGMDARVMTVWQPTSEVGAFAWYGAGSNMVNFAELDRAGAEAGGCVAEEGAQIARGRAFGPRRSLSRPPRPSGRRSWRPPIFTTRRP